jgi:HSP20 family protein
MLAKRNPLSLLRRLDTLGKEGDLFSSMIDDLFHFHGFSPITGLSIPDFSPSIDFIDKEDKYLISIEIPGMGKEDVKIELEDDVLVIKGEKKSEKKEDNDELYVCERCYGAFRRELRLPSDINKDTIDAGYDNGVLTINLPKTKIIEKETKQISIK